MGGATAPEAPRTSDAARRPPARGAAVRGRSARRPLQAAAMLLLLATGAAAAALAGPADSSGIGSVALTGSAALQGCGCRKGSFDVSSNDRGPNGGSGLRQARR